MYSKSAHSIWENHNLKGLSKAAFLLNRQKTDVDLRRKKLVDVICGTWKLCIKPL